MKVYLTLLFILFTYFISSAQVYEEYLLSGWTFRSEGSKYWLPAEVPGSVQSDLQLNGRAVNKDLKGDWLYRTHFVADEQILGRDHVELLFQGLDTRAEVYLNDQVILQANNMFRSWNIPVKSILKRGENKLEIRFKSPGSIKDATSRKAAYHFKEESDSSSVPIGIWKPVILQSWNKYKLVKAFISQEQLTDKEAVLTANIDIEGELNSTFEVEIFNEITDRTYARQQITLYNVNQQFKVPFSIKKPKRWWPVTMGEPNLYIIGIRVKNGTNKQALSKRIGLREVEISPNNQTDLSITINEKSVPLKGVTYQPIELFTSQMHSDDYNAIFDEVIESGYNAIRVLGSGIYENEYFYDLADTKGILLFQDFMFVEKLYPASADFLENVKAEAEENIDLLKQHPSLMLWSGSFKDDHTENKSKENLEKVLQESVKRLDPFHPYLDSLNTSSWKNLTL